MGSMSISVKEHSKQLCDKLQSLRAETNLVDLDLVCEDAHLHVHKVIMAASSKFFQEELCKSGREMAPLILKLEDFNLKLKREAVSYLVEFIYKGEVVIPADLLSSVCDAAHSLGVIGLIDFLPAPAKKATPPRVQESSTQIDDESFQAPSSSSTSESTSSTSTSTDLINSTSNTVVVNNPPNQQQQIIHQWPDQFPDFFQQHPGCEVNFQANNYPQSNQYKPFYNNYQEPNFNVQEATIVDLEAIDGQSQHAQQHQPIPQQPKGRLRIINQPEGPMTENIHDLKSTNQGQQANLETHSSNNSNSLLNCWMPNIPAVANFEQQQFEVENSLWYNSTEQGSSWTTPAASGSTWEATNASTTPNMDTNQESNPPKRKEEEVKLRPPPPLLAKGCKRPELEVRKDLTLPTAPTAREDNVFQADEDLPIVFEIEEDIDENDENQSEAKDNGGKKDFKCFQCSMMFSSDAQLRSHTRHTHKEEDTLLFCPVCKTAVLHGLENLKLHLYKSHGIGQVYRCEDCNYETSVKSNYVKHLNTTHSEVPKKMRMCNKCGKAFKSRCGLKLHLQTHEEDMQHECSFCDFKTPQKVNLVKHLAVKHKKDEHGEELKMNKACPLCPFKCVADYMLKSHMLRKHTAKEKMKYQCSQCDYASVEAAALKKHVRFKHTNERPFMCSICGFSTHTHSAMSRHKRSHEQSKPYVCQTCGMAYADRKRLRDHQAVHGNVALPFDCDFCGYSTRRKDNLQAHVKRLHPDLANKKPSSHIVGHVNQDGTIRPINNE